MGLLGVVSKTILSSTCFIWMVGIVGLFVVGRTFFAILAIIVFMIPFIMTLSNYLKDKRKSSSSMVTPTLRVRPDRLNRMIRCLTSLERKAESSPYAMPVIDANLHMPKRRLIRKTLDVEAEGGT